MGANAQTSVPAFTTGQVLTAQQQTEINTGVPVFATTTERDAAFGGTGEKVLAEGQLAYIEASDVVQYYNGASWATLAPASAPGLAFLAAGTYTTATSVSLPTNTFNATYRNYKVIFSNTAQTGQVTLTMRLRASGSDDTTSNYYQASPGFDADNNAQNTRNLGSTSYEIGQTANNATSGQFNIVLDVMQPRAGEKTIMAGFVVFVNENGFPETHAIGTFFNANTAFDSLSLISNVASSLTGLYRVYGYADS